MSKIKNCDRFGANLRGLRLGARLTQEQVTAQMQVMGCDVTRSKYSRYETGELNVRVGHLAALSAIFNCRYDDFFTGITPGNE